MALAHTGPGLVPLAPLYDTVPTVLWPSLRATRAMTVNGKANLDDIGPADIAAEAARWPLDGTVARSAAIATAQALNEAVFSLGRPERLLEEVAGRCRAFLARAGGG